MAPTGITSKAERVPLEEEVDLVVLAVEVSEEAVREVAGNYISSLTAENLKSAGRFRLGRSF